MHPFLALVSAASLLLAFPIPQAVSQEIPGVDDAPSESRHYTMDDLEVDVTQFVPVRGRYLQEMLDLEGNGTVQSRSFVHIEVDQALHSGPWDGQYPATMAPWREPGLVVDWKIQNAVYNAYDRVLTDSRLSTVLRAMPSSPYGLRMGATLDREHAYLSAPLIGTDSMFAVLRRPAAVTSYAAKVARGPDTPASRSGLWKPSPFSHP